MRRRFLRNCLIMNEIIIGQQIGDDCSKVLKVIDSCVTSAQLSIAQNMIICFSRKYPDIGELGRELGVLFSGYYFVQLKKIKSENSDKETKG